MFCFQAGQQLGNPYSNGMKIELQDVTISGALNCLNPYSNGMKIEQTRLSLVTLSFLGLNPYSNGMTIEFLVALKA